MSEGKMSEEEFQEFQKGVKVKVENLKKELENIVAIEKETKNKIKLMKED